MTWLIFSIIGALADLDSILDPEVSAFIGDDTTFDFLRVTDDESLLNFISPSLLIQELKIMVSESREQVDYTVEFLETELEVLHIELEKVYQKLFKLAVLLVEITPQELLEMAEKLSVNDNIYEVLESSRLHRVFQNEDVDEYYAMSSDVLYDEEDRQILQQLHDLNDVTPIETDESTNVTYYDPDNTYKLLLDSFEKMPDNIESQGSVFQVLKKIKKKAKKFIKKIKKKIWILIKLIKLKKVIRQKKIKFCIKLMMTIEKIKKCLMLIKHIIIKKIKWFIKDFPWDVLRKVKLIMRLVLRIIDDIIWSAEIFILSAILKVFRLLGLLKSVPMELIIYFKLELMDKFGLTDEIAGQEAEAYYEDIVSKKALFDEITKPVDDLIDDEENYSYYHDNGIEYVQSDSNHLVNDEVENLMRKHFTVDDVENFLGRHNLFNPDVSFEFYDDDDEQDGKE